LSSISQVSLATSTLILTSETVRKFLPQLSRAPGFTSRNIFDSPAGKLSFPEVEGRSPMFSRDMPSTFDPSFTRVDIDFFSVFHHLCSSFIVLAGHDSSHSRLMNVIFERTGFYGVGVIGVESRKHGFGNRVLLIFPCTSGW